MGLVFLRQVRSMYLMGSRSTGQYRSDSGLGGKGQRKGSVICVFIFDNKGMMILCRILIRKLAS